MITKMLASVRNLEEAAAILSTGIDIIDIKEPGRGALGAVDPDTIQMIVKKVAGKKLTSATIGDLPLCASTMVQAIDRVETSGVDIIKIGVFSGFIPDKVLQLIKKKAQTGTRIVLVFFADLKTFTSDIKVIADHGVCGVMLDTAYKKNGNLRTILTDNELEDFLSGAQGMGLLAGLAGSLNQHDIKPLLDLMPDFLGFRSVLCQQHNREMKIDLHAVNLVRSMIPEENRSVERVSVIK
jgi:(5-formylfuran-3-yl)methyl phosphate synthase